MSESIYQNGILLSVPDGYKQLCTRKLDLDKIADGEPLVMRDLYNQVAQEFEEIGYTIVANNCRRKAAQWQGIYNEMPKS